jgi:hypothetical protein
MVISAPLAASAGASMVTAALSALAGAAQNIPKPKAKAQITANILQFIFLPFLS